MQSKQKLNFQLPECAISLSFSLISSFVCGAGVKREIERDYWSQSKALIIYSVRLWLRHNIPMSMVLLLEWERRKAEIEHSLFVFAIMSS